MKIVFFGTPPFAAEILEFLIEQGISIVAVVSKPDRPKGRSGKPVPTPVKGVAEKFEIPLFQPEKASDPEFAKVLQPLEADLFIVVAYGEIIKQHLLDMPKLGCVNVHASLLPKYRGAAPIQHSIISGEKESGVTIMHMVKKMDAGDIILQKVVPIGKNMTAGELSAILCQKGKEGLLEMIALAKKGTLPGKEQNHEQATMAPKLELADGYIDWEQPAEVLHNRIRGVTPYPGAWCYLRVKGEKKRLKILAARFAEGKGIPGEILSYDGKNFIVACGSNALSLLSIQLEGKKTMDADLFMRGTSRDALQFLPEGV